MLAYASGVRGAGLDIWIRPFAGGTPTWAQKLDATTKRPVGEPTALRHFHDARLGMMQSRFNQFDLGVASDTLLLTLAERTGNIWLAATDAGR